MDNETDAHMRPNMLIMSADLKAVLDSLPFYVILVDQNHKICFANEAVSGQLGAAPDSIIGEYCPKAIHGKDYPIPECPLEESFQSGKPVEREVYDEHNGWFSSAIYPTELKTYSGTQVFFHMVHDINKRKAAEQALKDSLDKLSDTIESAIKAISLLVEKRDPYTAGHQTRVGRIAYLIAKELGLSEQEAQHIRISGLLHDIGKIVVPIEILSKPGVLNEHEFELIKMHSVVGREILKEIDFSWPAAEIVLQHHERLNGSGYPAGLKEGEILFEARVIGVADVLEAKTSFRPYRPAMNVKTVLDELLKNRDILYDRSVVDACIKLCNENKLDLQYVNMFTQSNNCIPAGNTADDLRS